MKPKKLSPMFFNPSVSPEEETRQAAAWKQAETRSLKRYRALIRETFYPRKPCPKDNVTEEMIERARDHPIENLIEANGSGMALCIFHEDRRPSMSIKKYNRAHCFTCGEKADTIKVYMTIHGSSFHEAVRALCN